MVREEFMKLKFKYGDRVIIEGVAAGPLNGEVGEVVGLGPRSYYGPHEENKMTWLVELYSGGKDVSIFPVVWVFESDLREYELWEE
jgi:hypothetical protein